LATKVGLWDENERRGTDCHPPDLGHRVRIELHGLAVDTPENDVSLPLPFLDLSDMLGFSGNYRTLPEIDKAIVCKVGSGLRKTRNKEVITLHCPSPLALKDRFSGFQTRGTSGIILAHVRDVSTCLIWFSEDRVL